MKSVDDMPAAQNHRESWIPLLETATREVFELMLSCQVTIVPPDQEAKNRNVTAIVGLAGQLCGVLSVRCEGKTAAVMASKMLGVPLDKFGPEVADALGEVCNMVAGNFKNKIRGLAEGCMLSPPTIVTGADYSLQSLADSPDAEVQLLFESMPVVISLRVQS